MNAVSSPPLLSTTRYACSLRTCPLISQAMADYWKHTSRVWHWNQRCDKTSARSGGHETTFRGVNVALCVDDASLRNFVEVM